MKVKSLTPQQLGRRIRSLRQEKGFSQEQLAEPDYTAAYISHVEHGKRRPSQEALGHIAGRLGVTLEQLVSGRDPTENLRLEIEIQRALGEIHAGKVEAAKLSLEEARNQADLVGLSSAVQAADLGLGRALLRLGELDESYAAFSRALAAVSDRPPELRTSALVGQARVLFHKGEMRDAVHLLESHLVDIERSDSPDPGCLVETYAALIPAYFESGLIERAKDVASRGLALAPGVPDLDQRACLYVNRAQLMLTQGETREALSSLALAADLYRLLGWHSEMVKVMLARSLTLTEQGDLEEAEELLEGILADQQSAISRADRVRAHTQLAMIRRLAGSPTQGQELARKALDEAGKDFPVSAAEAAREAGLCARELGEGDAALRYWREALKVFLERGDHEEAARTARLIGDHLLANGDAEAAAEAYKQGLGPITQLR